MYGNQEIPFNVYEDYEDASPLPIQIQAVEIIDEPVSSPVPDEADIGVSLRRHVADHPRWQVTAGHGTESDVHLLCHTVAQQCKEHNRLLKTVVLGCGEEPSENESKSVDAEGFSFTRKMKQAAPQALGSRDNGCTTKGGHMPVKPPLLKRLTSRRSSLGPAAYAAVLSLVVLGLAGATGVGLHLPWLFPSLGPTVMLFFESPEQPSARPANTIIGHVTGLLTGLGCLYAFGLHGTASAPVGGLNLSYVAAGASSVALTTLVLTWLRMPHPPAGATTLIVSLGILTTAPQLLSMVGAILLVTAAGWGLNVLLGTRPAAAN